MRVSIRSGLVGLLVAGAVPLSVADAWAQAPATKAKPAPPPAPASKGSAAPAAKAAATPAPAPGPSTAKFDQIVATVNGEPITRGDLINFLSRYQIPPVGPEQIYHDAVETLVNTRLIGQFLNRQKIPVPPEKVNEAIAQLERDLKADGRDLRTALQESSQTMDDVRREYVDRIRWVEYLNLKGTDAELKKFATNHKDLVSGTQVKASHIYLALPPNATAADKEKVRQKLLAIKRDIQAKKVSFAEAADTSTEDPANTKGAGGDIGYFGRNTGIVEEFANAAFALKPGELSDPVETSHGLHLIQVTDRKEGNPIDFDQQKPFILQLYAAELQKQILMAEWKSAGQNHSIDIKPMPPDLFPPTTPAGAASPAPVQNAPARDVPK